MVSFVAFDFIRRPSHQREARCSRHLWTVLLRKSVVSILLQDNYRTLDVVLRASASDERCPGDMAMRLARSVRYPSNQAIASVAS